MRARLGRRRALAVGAALIAVGAAAVIAVSGAGGSDGPEGSRSGATEEWIKSGQDSASDSDGDLRRRPRAVEFSGVGADEFDHPSDGGEGSAASAQGQSDEEVRAELKTFRKHLAALAKANARVVTQLRSNYSGPIREGSGELAWPVRGPVTSPFGQRWGRLHAGIDIGVSSGTPIQAADDGTVVLIGLNGGYGNFTCVGHGGGMTTCYAHQSRFGTELGADVRKGEVIGFVGCTGHCFGDHLHFEVRIDGSPTDPLGYL